MAAIISILGAAKKRSFDPWEKNAAGQFHLVTLLQSEQGTAKGWCFWCIFFT